MKVYKLTFNKTLNELMELSNQLDDCNSKTLMDFHLDLAYCWHVNENKNVEVYLLINEVDFLNVQLFLNLLKIEYTFNDISNIILKMDVRHPNKMVQMLFQTYISDHTEIDEILDRINEVGIENLTQEEKYVLEYRN